MNKRSSFCYLLITSGGWYSNHQLVQYDIVKGSFVDYGTQYLSSTLGNSDGEYGQSIYYTQINETTLFTINRNGDCLHVYNLQTLSFQELGTTIPINVNEYACISSSVTPTPRLYITVWDDLQVVTLSDLEWLTNTPSMTDTRLMHGCIVVNDVLWAIGGLGEYSVEIINITNIADDTWNVIGRVPGVDFISKMGVTAVDDVIFIVGGGPTGGSLDTVYAIDTITYSIGIYGDRLPTGVNGMSVVAAGHTIYGFGGLSYSWVSFDFLCGLSFEECFSYRPTSEPTVPTEFSVSVCGMT